jgi:hypothetical protein
MIFALDRRRLRRAYRDVWHKHQAGMTLEPLDQVILGVILEHPEYHPLLDTAEALEQEYPTFPEATNPFLHMGMHIAIREQLAMDRPPGIRDLYRLLLPHYEHSHALEHGLMECLGQSLGQAQNQGRLPEEADYLHCVRQFLEKRQRS